MGGPHRLDAAEKNKAANAGGCRLPRQSKRGLVVELFIDLRSSILVSNTGEVKHDIHIEQVVIRHVMRSKIHCQGRRAIGQLRARFTQSYNRVATSSELLA